MDANNHHNLSLNEIVTVEVDERLAKRLERLEQGEEDEEDQARLEISDAREASSVRRGRGRIRPGGVLRDVVAAVERRGTSRVASVGASVGAYCARAAASSHKMCVFMAAPLASRMAAHFFGLRPSEIFRRQERQRRPAHAAVLRSRSCG